MAKKEVAKKTVAVEQIGSPIRRPAVQRATLIGLGLNKMHRVSRSGRYTFRSWHDPGRPASRSRRRREVRGIPS